MVIGANVFLVTDVISKTSLSVAIAIDHRRSCVVASDRVDLKN